MDMEKSIKFGREDGEVVVIVVGELVKVTTKDETYSGEVVNIGDNYLELLIAKYNINQYVSVLLVNIKDIEIMED